jgi:hypothetical protein
LRWSCDPPGSHTKYTPVIQDPRLTRATPRVMSLLPMPRTASTRGTAFLPCGTIFFIKNLEDYQSVKIIINKNHSLN